MTEMNTERPQDETKVGTILTVGAAGILIVVASVVGLTALFTATADSEQQAKAASGLAADICESVDEQEEKLASYGWVDREKGVVRIPIERAMELLVNEAKEKGDPK
jgi:hypothetical protein